MASASLGGGAWAGAGLRYDREFNDTGVASNAHARPSWWAYQQASRLMCATPTGYGNSANGAIATIERPSGALAYDSHLRAWPPTDTTSFEALVIIVRFEWTQLGRYALVPAGAANTYDLPLDLLAIDMTEPIRDTEEWGSFSIGLSSIEDPVLLVTNGDPLRFSL
jgi:hypothetical protein